MVCNLIAIVHEMIECDVFVPLSAHSEMQFLIIQLHCHGLHPTQKAISWKEKYFLFLKKLKFLSFPPQTVEP